MVKGIEVIWIFNLDKVIMVQLNDKVLYSYYNYFVKEFVILQKVFIMNDYV